MRSSRYSALKAFKFPDRIAAIRDGTVAAPVHVQLILSDLCNQACHFCAYRDPTYTSSQLFHVNGDYNPNRMLPIAKVMEILDDCAEMGVRAIQLTGGGEPTVHPQFAEIVQAIVKRGMQWALVTNGVLQRWDCTSAAWIRVSLDAGTPETYAKIRNAPETHFHKACDTIRRYRAGVGFVVTPENWKEIATAARLAKDIGASSFRIGAQFSEDATAPYQPFKEAAEGLAQIAEAYSDESFEVINRLTEKLDELGQGAPEYARCGYQHFTTYIGADQNLYRCCVYAYNPRGLIGSIKDRRFKDVWREIAHADFQKFDARGCARCQFSRINESINEVLEASNSEAFV